MNTGMIPVRYAKALFEFAAEKGCDERVYGQMGKLAAAFVREGHYHRHVRRITVESVSCNGSR